MLRFYIVLFWSAVACGCLWAQGGEYHYRVKEAQARAALRAVPDAAGDVVAFWAAGREVVSPDDDQLGTQAWVRVRAPDEVSLWVYAELIREGRIAANHVQARCGAGINYKPVKTLQRGDGVEMRGRMGDWMRIKAPPGTLLWMARSDLESVAQMGGGGADGGDGNGGARRDDNRRDVALVPERTALQEFAGFAFAAGLGQGIRTFRQGRIDWPSFWEQGLPETCVYALADQSGLATLLLVDHTGRMADCFGQQVVVSGTLWYLGGVRLPVLIANEIKIR